MSRKLIRLLSFVLIASSLAGCQLTTSGENGHNGNWAPLFNGQDLDGW